MQQFKSGEREDAVRVLNSPFTVIFSLSATLISISAGSARVYTAHCAQRPVSDQRAVLHSDHQCSINSVSCVAVYQQTCNDRTRSVRSYEYNECLWLDYVSERGMDQAGILSSVIFLLSIWVSSYLPPCSSAPNPTKISFNSLFFFLSLTVFCILEWSARWSIETISHSINNNFSFLWSNNRCFDTCEELCVWYS